MRTDFTPDNVEIWISNWKKTDLISDIARQWLNTFEFERINIIANHSSVSIDNFDDDIKSRIKVWNNVMRHDYAIGPMVENYNQAYVHTFLSGKKYCICAHDSMIIKEGWVDIIRNTDYLFYMAPQGDQVTLMTLEGLQTFGWWDERYATNGNHELDYAVRVLRADIGHNKASLVDYHNWYGWPTEEYFEGTNIRTPVVRLGHPEFGNGFPYLRWNDVGLDRYWIREDKRKMPQFDSKQIPSLTPKYEKIKWNDIKWRNHSPSAFDSFIEGPTVDEIDWYPWLDINTITAMKNSTD
jgi:hypothetical protein